MNLAETFMYLEDLEVSRDSNSESDIEINNPDCTRIFIQPPVNANGGTLVILTLPMKKN